MNRPDPAPGGGCLLHCNLERTLLLARDPSGEQVVIKLLLRGSPADAEHECRFGQLLDRGVARYLAAETDATSGRPSLRLCYHAGTNLDELVAVRGALPAAAACATLAPVAHTLARAHGLRTSELPNGFCHGDVKPGNLLRTEDTTLLLDFEHAGPTHQRACAGTPGFAAPEAETGAPLHPSFDVYGLGATLHWLLTGATVASGRLCGHDAELQLLVDACLARDPRSRPTAATVAEALEELAGRLPQDPLEPARAALFAGDLDAAARHLEGHDDAELARLLTMRRRLLQRHPHCLDRAREGNGAMADPATLDRSLRWLEAMARRFPRHAPTIAARSAGKSAAAALLASSLPRVFALVRDERIDAARRLLADLMRMTHSALQLPGRLVIPGDQSARMPTLLQRAPLKCLEQEQQRLEAAAAEHGDLLATLHAAEAALALDDAASAIDNISSRYGGTSDAVARHRDRLHRLGFYVERIARGRGNVERLHELLPREDPAALLAFVDECAAAVTHSSSADDPTPGSIGLRSLQLALANLREEFPAVAARAEPAQRSLDRALAQVTEEAWKMIGGAQQMLAAEPVPVRPLLLLLGRLDTFRALEAFIDRPDQTRSALIDRVEALRLRLEQAQATRDRLARGAEQALAKGHWTTGLFDMERAVTHLAGDDEEDRQAAQLRQRLADAKRRKQEIEQAQRRNHDLTSRYAALQDDSRSTTSERLQILREHRDCLQFLSMHAHKDRSDLYARDQRAIELNIAQEQASQAEAELDITEAPPDRQRIAAQALAQLEALAARNDPGSELPGRLRRLIDHWRRRHEHENRTAERVLAEGRARLRRRRWLRAIGGAATLLLAAVLVRALTSPVEAAGRHPVVVAAESMPAALRQHAESLAIATIDAEGLPAAGAYVEAMEGAVRAFLAATTGGDDTARQRFAALAWRNAEATARSRAHEAAQRDRLDAELEAANKRLRADGLRD